VAGQLIDADDVAEEEALLGDGRGVGHNWVPVLRGGSGGYSAAP
jgi:hypothetical protein